MSALQFKPRRLRRTAGVTLVVWLLALAAGVVNACALTPDGRERVGLHADVGPEHPVAEAHAGALPGGRHAVQGEPAVHHGHEQDAGSKSCLKFCDDESSAVVKVKPPAVDGAPVLAIPTPAWQPGAATGGAGWGLSSQRPGSQGPPLVIRFLRLTL